MTAADDGSLSGRRWPQTTAAPDNEGQQTTAAVTDQQTSAAPANDIGQQTSAAATGQQTSTSRRRPVDGGGGDVRPSQPADDSGDTHPLRPADDRRQRPQLTTTAASRRRQRRCTPSWPADNSSQQTTRQPPQTMVAQADIGGGEARPWCNSGPSRQRTLFLSDACPSRSHCSSHLDFVAVFVLINIFK